MLQIMSLMSVGLAIVRVIPSHEVSVVRTTNLILVCMPLWVAASIWWQFDASFHGVQGLVILSSCQGP